MVGASEAPGWAAGLGSCTDFNSQHCAAGGWVGYTCEYLPRNCASPMMLLIRLISACVMLWGFCSSEMAAQRRTPSFSEQSLDAPVLHVHSTLPSSQGTREGAIWSGIGATTGSLVGFPVFVILALGSSCQRGDTDLTCYAPLVPFGIGAAVGGSLGAETGGDHPAWKTTIIGTAIGTAVAAIVGKPYAERDVQAKSRVLAIGLFTVPPAIGAWIGNRLGQPR